MPNPKGINQYSKGAGKKPAVKSGKTAKTLLKEQYQQGTKSLNTTKKIAKSNTMPGLSSRERIGHDNYIIARDTKKLKGIKAAIRKAK